MRIRALIISLIAALTIGTMAATNTLLPALEYAGDLGEEKLNELQRFASAQVNGPNGRFLDNNYIKGDCYPQNMEFTYAENPTAHTVQVRTEGDSILVTDDRGRTHVLAGISPIPKREEYAQRAAELLIRGDHPVTIYLLEEKEATRVYHRGPGPGRKPGLAQRQTRHGTGGLAHWGTRGMTTA